MFFPSYVFGLVYLFPRMSLASHIFALTHLCPRVSLPLYVFALAWLPLSRMFARAYRVGHLKDAQHLKGEFLLVFTYNYDRPNSGTSPIITGGKRSQGTFTHAHCNILIGDFDQQCHWSSGMQSLPRHKFIVTAAWVFLRG